MSGHSEIDYERSVCLCDVGAPEYAAAVCVTASGDDVLWLISKSQLGVGNPHCGDANQPHEQLGPLPALVRDRIDAIRGPGIPLRGRLVVVNDEGTWYQDDNGGWSQVYRCGRPTKKKHPCKIAVAQAGDACQFHGPKPPTPRCWGCNQLMEKQGTVWGCRGCDPDGYWTQADWLVTQ